MSRTPPPMWARLLGAAAVLAGLLGNVLHPLLVLGVAFTGSPGSEEVMLALMVGGATLFGVGVLAAAGATLLFGSWRLIQSWVAVPLGLLMFLQAAAVFALAVIAQGMAWH